MRRLQSGKLIQPKTVPLSTAQREILFFSRLGEGGSCAFQLGAFLDFSRELDHDGLSRTLHFLIRRHDALRLKLDENSFTWELIPPENTFLPLAQENASSPEQVSAITDTFRRTPVELEGAPLIHALHVRHSGGSRILLQVHHIICDGHSLSILLNELRDTLEGRSLPAPSLFSSFLKDKRGVTHTEHAARRSLSMPLDFSCGTDFHNRARVLHLTIPAPLRSSIHDLGEELHCSPFFLYLTCFHIFLRRQTDSKTTTVGVPLAAQGFSAPDRLVGHCVRLEYLSLSFSPSDTFATLVSQLRELIRGLPPEEGAEHPYPPGSSPLQILLSNFRFSKRPTPDIDNNQGNPALSVQWDFLDPTHCHSAIFCELIETSQESVITWTIHREAFSSETAVQWLIHYQSLLRNLVDQSEAPLSTISGLDQAIRRQILHDWSGIRGLSSKEGSNVVSHFGNTARVHATKIAISQAAKKLTYEELATQACSIACAILNTREGHHTGFIGLYGTRTSTSIASILGILQAGSAYVPLSVEDPPDHIRHLVETTKLTRIVSSREHAESLTQFIPPLVEVLIAEDLIAAGPIKNVSFPSPSHDAPAVVLFTSGSTGEPKATVIPHRAILRTVLETTYLSFDDQVTTFLISRLSFDVSLMEVFGALLHGGRLALPPHEHLSISEISSSLLEEEVTTLWLTAGLFHLVMEESPELI
ncbi:MAG: AMP-binding protein, partial [Verrucomicrobiota bacterium]